MNTSIKNSSVCQVGNEQMFWKETMKEVTLKKNCSKLKKQETKDFDQTNKRIYYSKAFFETIQKPKKKIYVDILDQSNKAEDPRGLIHRGGEKMRWNFCREILGALVSWPAVWAWRTPCFFWGVFLSLLCFFVFFVQCGFDGFWLFLDAFAGFYEAVVKT